jgi:ribosomal protein S18 acetylase RimI-like enzyme
MSGDMELTMSLFAPGPRLNEHKDDLWHVLEATDHDFVPPLSARAPTTLGKIEPAHVAFALPIEHLEFQLGLHVILAKQGQRVMGFLSFLPDFHHDMIDKMDSCVLIDTVAVMPSMRRSVVRRELYKALFASAEFQRHTNAVLHMWSTNQSHCALIESIGFREIRRIVDDRGPGIDTLIYTRTTTPDPFENEPDAV